MDKKSEWFEGRKVLDHLKSKHKADTSKAEIEMALLAQEKQKHGFHVFVTSIRWRVAQSCGLDPKQVLKDVEEEL